MQMVKKNIEETYFRRNFFCMAKTARLQRPDFD